MVTFFVQSVKITFQSSSASVFEILPPSSTAAAASTSHVARRFPERRRSRVGMSTLPIFDYGVPVEDGDVLDAGGAPVGPAAEIASKVPTSVSSERGSAIVPPFGADDLVSRAQWQWAIGESDIAGKTGGPTNGGVSTAPDASPVTTKKRPTQRPKPNPSKDAAGLKNQSVKLPPPTSAHQTSHPSASTAEQAIAKVVVTEARGKLNVVERLLEDKPVECGDEEYHAVETSAEAQRKLARLVKPLTGEEFMSACEERCLTGKCGWPLCAVPLETAKRGMNGGFLGNSNDSRETSVRGTFRERRKIGGENGAAGAVVGGRGTYRIDALHRKVYLREDLEMFCCATHRSAAEALGVSLALSLDPSPTTTTTKKDTDGTGNKNAETDLMTAANLEKAKAMGDANKHVKAGVFERKAPVVVERSVSSGVFNSPTSAASANLEGLGGLGKKAASAVEGFVPREARAGSKTKTKTKQQVSFATASEQPLGAKNTSMVGTRKHPVSEPPSQETKHQPPPGLPPNDDGMVASSLNPRALDSFVERRAGPDDSTLSTDETARCGAFPITTLRRLIGLITITLTVYSYLLRDTDTFFFISATRTETPRFTLAFSGKARKTRRKRGTKWERSRKGRSRVLFLQPRR